MEGLNKKLKTQNKEKGISGSLPDQNSFEIKARQEKVSQKENI